MRIDDKMLHIPPHISVHWSRISALYVKNGILVVTLVDGDTLQISHLSEEILEKIFTAHATFLEQEPSPRSQSAESAESGNLPSLPRLFLRPLSGEVDENPIKISFGAFDEMGTAMQHNPEQANSPDLPPEVLNKVATIAQIVSPEEAHFLPKPEPHCNCIHCQFARAIHKGIHVEEEIEEIEEVTDADLHFQQWDIVQKEEKLFKVTNRLDAMEEYTVFLGEPVGCTCGKENCDHIVAVLKS